MQDAEVFAHDFCTI